MCVKERAGEAKRRDRAVVFCGDASSEILNISAMSCYP